VYAQPDPDLARAILDNLAQPHRFFSMPHLLIGDAMSLNVLRSSQITRVDLISKLVPEWPFQFGAVGVREITEEAFQQSAQTRESTELKVVDEKPDAPALEMGYVSLILSDGQQVFWEVREPKGQHAGADLISYVNGIFNSFGLHARRRGQGVMIINPMHIVRFSLHPCPEHVPGKTWSAARP
jgi:hypothetical protein